MTFTRTPAGLVEKWRFYTVPTIWVEGPTDIFFYEPVLEGIECRIEAYHGCGNADALVDGLTNWDYPYIIVRDGDYSILEPNRRNHRRVIVLNRYSFENFLWEPDAVNRACLRHARCGDLKDILGAEMNRVAEHLRETMPQVIALDVAARRCSPAPPVLPDRIERLLTHDSCPDIDPKKIETLVSSVEALIDPNAVAAAQSEVQEFLGKRCITHLLKGHLVLGILRRIFLRAASHESGSNAAIANDVLTQMLSEMVWRRCKSDDHKQLMRALRRKTRLLIARFSVPGASAS